MYKYSTTVIRLWQQNGQTLAWVKEELAKASGLQALRLQLLENCLLRDRQRLSDQLVIKGEYANVPAQTSVA